MGWDDSDEDDWDDVDVDAKLEAQLKEKEKAKRREEGLDSESEEEKAPEPKAEESKPKPKPKPKADKKKAQPKAEEAPPVNLNSQEEKLRQRKLVEEADARLANDLFSGCEKPKEESKAEQEERERKEREEAARKAAAAAKPKILVVDAFDKVQLEKQADVEQLCNTCVEKINKGQAKTAAAKFLGDLLKQLEGNLESKELQEIEKAIVDMVKQKQAEKGAKLQKDNKANTKLSKTTKFNTASEWEEVYGGGDGDEDWTQEEWDEWNKSQGY